MLSALSLSLCAGILALPAGWKDGGMGATTFLLLLLAFVAGWAIFRLVECCEIIMLVEARALMHRRLQHAAKVEAGLASAKPMANPSDEHDDPRSEQLFIHDASQDHLIAQEDWAQVTLPTFADVGACAFGKWGRVVIDASILITQFGACIAYVIFISTNLHDVIPAKHMTSSAWVAVFFLPLLSLSLIRRIDRLAPASMLGNFVYLFTVSVIFGVGFKDYCCIEAKHINWIGIEKLPLVFGTCSFALEGIPLILPIKKRMADQKAFPRLMMISLCIVTTLYLSFGILGYAFFKSETHAPVIDSLPAGPLADTVKVALSISLFFTFGLQIYPISEFLDLKIDLYLGVDSHALDEKHGHHDVTDPALVADDFLHHTSSSSKLAGHSGSLGGGAAGAAGHGRRLSGADVGLLDGRGSSGDVALTPSPMSSSFLHGAAIGVGGAGAVRAPSDGFDDVDGGGGDEAGVGHHRHASHLVVHLDASDMRIARKRRVMQVGARVATVVLISGVAIVFPDFKLIISLFGSFSNAMLAYIFPAIFWVRIAASSYIYGHEYFPYNRHHVAMKHPLQLAAAGLAGDAGAGVGAPGVGVDGAPAGLRSPASSASGSASSSALGGAAAGTGRSGNINGAGSKSLSRGDDAATSKLLGGAAASSASASAAGGGYSVLSDDGGDVADGGRGAAVSGASGAQEVDVNGKPVDGYVKLKHLWLPVTVACVGMLSSGIGVAESMRAIIDAF